MRGGAAPFPRLRRRTGRASKHDATRRRSGYRCRRRISSHSAFIAKLFSPRVSFVISGGSGSGYSHLSFAPRHGKWALERGHRAFAPIGKKAMLFNGIVHPEQVTILATVLDEYCREAGIDRETPEHDQIARLVITLFNNGAATLDELRGALDERVEWKAMRCG